MFYNISYQHHETQNKEYYEFNQNNNNNNRNQVGYNNNISTSPFGNQVGNNNNINTTPFGNQVGNNIKISTTPFEEFNKFNVSKVESSELNNRELKTTKLIKNPTTDFEDLSVEEIQKYAFSLAKDQAGCRFLQKKLEEIPNFANDIFPRVKQLNKIS